MKTLILLTFLTLSTYYIYQSIDIESFFSKDKTKSFKDAKVSVTYILSDKWLTFNIPKDDSLFKILSTANIYNEKLNYENELNYAINYQIIDNNNKIVTDKIYHFNTKVLKFIKEETEIRPSYYLDNSIIPALSKKKFINIANFQNGSKIRFKIYSKNREIKDIAIRTYIKEINREDKLTYLWERLSRKSKEALASSNIYGYELMSEDEKRNVLREVFRPFGPLGVKDKDYFIRKLYVLKDEEIESVDERLEEFKNRREFNETVLIKRSFFVENNISFKINHFKNLITPIKLDINLIDKNSSTLTYSLFDRDLNLIKRDNLKIESNFSKNIYLDELNISETNRYFLKLSSDVSKIEFNSNDKAFISLYNRLYNYPRVEIIKNNERNVSETWFNLTPIEDKKEVFLKLFPMSETVEENLTTYSIYPLKLSSDYLFIDYNLTNYDKKTLTLIYSKIPLNREITLNFDYIFDEFEPKLIFKKKSFKPQKIEIYLNGNLYFRDELIGTKGTLELPTIKRGKHKITIKSKESEIYINHITNENLENRQKRLVNRFKKSSFKFSKTKNSELISLKVFQPFESEKVKVKLKINSKTTPNTPHKEFTFLNREYIIYPNRESKTYILNRDLVLGGGNLIFISLNDDLANREYKIDIEVDKEVYFNIYSKMDEVSSFDVLGE